MARSLRTARIATRGIEGGNEERSSIKFADDSPVFLFSCLPMRSFALRLVDAHSRSSNSATTYGSSIAYCKYPMYRDHPHFLSPLHFSCFAEMGNGIVQRFGAFTPE